MASETAKSTQNQTFRWTEEKIALFRGHHANTFPEHRLSFNAWVLRALEFSLANGFRS